MDVVASFVAYLDAPEAVQPRQSSFHNPPVSPQLLAGFDAPSGYARGYAPLPQSLTASREVVSLASVQLLRAFARSATRLAYRLDGVHGFLQNLGVVNVGCRVDHTERDTSSVDHNMALGALLSLVRRIRSGVLAPRGQLRSPSPKTPAPSRSGLLLLNGPRASDAVVPTPPPRSIL
jgi:hypothetical protein